MRNATGEKQSIAETQVALARLAANEGRLAEAESALRKCKNQFQQDAQADDEILASAALIEVLLKGQNFPAAKTEAEATAALAGKTHNLYARLEFNLQAAQVQSWSNNRNNLGSAREALSAVLKEARAHSLVGVELQTELAQAELEVEAAHPGADRETFPALEKSASRAGFGLIARQASALQASLH